MAADSLAKKNSFLKNWFYSAASWGLPMALAFVATPILIHGLGADDYGIYAALFGFITYTFSNGVGKVAAKYIPEFRAAGESRKLSQALSAACLFALGLGGAQAALLIAAAPFVVTDVLKLDPSRGLEVTLYLASMSGLVLMVGQVFQYSIQGVHRFDIFALVGGLNSLLLTVGNVVLVLAGYGILSLFVWSALMMTITGVVSFMNARRLLPEWRLGVAIDKDIWAAILHYAGSIIVYQALSGGLFLFERSWIIRTLGAEALTFYVVPIMLAVYMHGLVASFSHVLFPVVNELLADRLRLLQVYQRATKLILVITFFIVASFIGSGEVFLGLWLGSEFAARSYTLLVILGIAFGFNVISMAVWQLAEAFRAPGINVFSSFLWLAAAVPIMIYATSGWGLEGAAAGRLAGAALTLPLIAYIERRFLGEFMGSFWASMLLRLAPAAAALVLVAKTAHSMVGTSWLGLVTGAAVSSIAFVLIVIATGFFTRDEIELVLARIGLRDLASID